MTKSTEDVARDVIDGIVDEHGTKWWRGRAITLAVKYLMLLNAQETVRVANKLEAAP